MLLAIIGTVGKTGQGGENFDAQGIGSSLENPS
jgi:hypothetical protein